MIPPSTSIGVGSWGVRDCFARSRGLVFDTDVMATAPLALGFSFP